jgi:hypothetical protein
MHGAVYYPQALLHTIHFLQKIKAHYTEYRKVNVLKNNILEQIKTDNI